VEIDDRQRVLDAAKSANDRLLVGARERLDGGSPGKYLSSKIKAKSLRQLIHTLKVPNSNPPKYVSDSKEMGRLASNYHNTIQDEQPPLDPREYTVASRDVFQNIDNKLAVSDQESLSKKLMNDEIEAALSRGKNESAPGIDGIPYELWKLLHESAVNSKKRNEPAFDICQIIADIANDITMFGLSERSPFNEGWLCPLFKKGDLREIQNYRPITCLNTDYKLITKAMATRLAKVAPSIIHENQAGFVPGRNILNQTDLVRTIIAFAEEEEIDGAIVALDQEKAYDKIDHKYLWDVLDAFGVPANFITLVRNLYSDASTRILINGFLSDPIHVRRGVRQGDPLSCLLFIIAIEPLATLLRKSDLNGLKIPGKQENLIATLFADDTTIYLNKNDQVKILFEILKKWCRISRAKFNVQKTEVIPIGTATFHQSVVTNNALGDVSNTFPENTRIAKNKTPIQILGARVGNNLNQESLWL
jgi:hypothetical protein